MSEASNEESLPTKPVKRRGGAKEVLDAKKQAEICAILAMGCSRRCAAGYVGCSVNTILNTARRKPEFAAALLKADAQQEVTLISRIHAATKRTDGWRAAAWLLQHTRPDYYARRADTMTPEQVAGVLSQFAEILSRGIRDAEDRARVGNDLRLLTSALANEAAGEQVR